MGVIAPPSTASGRTITPTQPALGLFEAKLRYPSPIKGEEWRSSNRD